MNNLVILAGLLSVTLSATVSGGNLTNLIKINQNQPKPEEVITKLDLNKDGKITKEEAKGQLKTDFSTIDKNADGFITLDELKKAPKPDRAHHERPNPEELMKKMDVNKDGKISKEEAKGPLGENFKKIDANKDGYITKDELKNTTKSPEKK